MDAALEKENTPSPLDRCSIVVIYDDPFSRTRALSACDYLMSQLWEDVELDFYWWRTDFLSDTNMARAAAHYAVATDFLIICSSGIDAPSNILETWFESWIPERKKHEGALIDLSFTPKTGHRSTRLQQILQRIAEQGRFDYLTAMATQPLERHRPGRNLSSTRLPSTDPLVEYPRPPSRFGLNE